MQLHTQNNHLTIGGLKASDIAEKFDTPTFATDASIIKVQFKKIHDAFNAHGKTVIRYACKANSNPAILQLLHSLGAQADCVSPGEVALCLKAGFAADQIMFTGTNPRNDELAYLAKTGIHINLDSLSMARRFPTDHSRNFSIRINPRVGAGHHEHVVTGHEETKFGLHENDLVTLTKTLKERGDKLTGLHAHIGSGIMDEAPYLVLIDELARISKFLAETCGMTIDTIDIGGGYGIPYEPNEKPLNIEQVAERIWKRIDELFPKKPLLAIEPGRFIVAESTYLLTRINTVKETPRITFLGVDAGFNTLVRPTMYDAYHHIVAADKMDKPATEHYTICGPICETGDILGSKRSLPTCQEGDLLAICDAGAYGFAMASHYNTRGLPAEILIENGKAHIIRERESSY
ncbi:MAG: diaminopimelate decarboxylase [Deltaproteobacteria bacterium CG11_big_fil_rev_8_21_14_0_20_47_16]|nr:MAG: diaminopimelate decarboxylase [Deltaproteobacteria bacterium CG11_big_fil_rev_8_21_14_0_20_47_16]